MVSGNGLKIIEQPGSYSGNLCSISANDSGTDIDLFGLQFAASQLFKLVANAEELFHRLVSMGTIPEHEQEQISQWLILKHECDDCLSDGSEQHRSLQRIDEETKEVSSFDENESEICEEHYEDDGDSDEILLDHENCTKLIEQVSNIMDLFGCDTDKLVLQSSDKDCCGCISNIATENSSANQSVNSEFHTKGARGRRTSIHSLNTPVASVSCKSSGQLSGSSKRELNKEKRILKQINTAQEDFKVQIQILKDTIKSKKDLLDVLLENKKMALKVENDRNTRLGQEAQQKVESLEHSLASLRMQLKKLMKHQSEGFNRKRQLEQDIQHLQEAQRSRNTNRSSNGFHSKAVALIRKSPLLTHSNEYLGHIRHEIRNLRKSREILLNEKFKVSNNVINENEERRLLQYEELIEGIDLIIEYKNGIMCGQDENISLIPFDNHRLMERLKFNEHEMRLLISKYFERVVELRASTKKLELQVADIENENEHWTTRVQSLSHTLQIDRLEAERKISVIQQDYEHKLQKILRKLLPGSENLAAIERRPESRTSHHQRSVVHQSSRNTGQKLVTRAWN